MHQKIEEIIKRLDLMFPNASCELIYNNNYELLVAVMLSAQTTDKSVNKVTKNLFSKYPSIYELSNANVIEVEEIIKTLGLYHNKAKNIISMAKCVCDNYNGEIPSDFLELTKLDGVGRKTANVYLVEYCNVPRIPVDTHVFRVSKRLGLANNDDSTLEVEKSLMKKFDSAYWHKLHHQLIFLGRYVCKAMKPDCSNCKLNDICKKVII